MGARDSVWYGRWMKLLEWLETNPSKKEILERFHNMLDARHSYGTRKNAGIAGCALDFAIEDRKRLEGVRDSTTKTLIKLCGCCGTKETKWKNIRCVLENGGNPEEKLDEVFNSVFSSLSVRRTKLHDGELSSDLKKAKECLEKLGAKEKLEKIQEAEAKWYAKQLSE